MLDEDGKRDIRARPRALRRADAERRPDAWFTYYYWLDDAKAPDYARTVDIHRKPGYDPVELFIDPAIRVPPLAIGSRLVRKKLGFRRLMDVIPLDATLVKGSHGRIPDDRPKGPLLMTRQADLLPDERPRHRRARHLILRHLGVVAAGGMTVVDRKAEHLRIAAGRTSSTPAGPDFGGWAMQNQGLPERNLKEMSLETTLLGAATRSAAVISAMTAAPRGRGGQRARHGARGGRARPGDSSRLRPSATRRPGRAPTCRARPGPPLLLGNLGDAQVRRPDAPERRSGSFRCSSRRPTVTSNPIQEAVQPEGEPGVRGRGGGDRRLSSSGDRATAGRGQGGRPGWDAADVALLATPRGGDRRRRRGRHQLGARGGRRDERAGDFAAAFADWGVPTADA